MMIGCVAFDFHFLQSHLNFSFNDKKRITHIIYPFQEKGPPEIDPSEIEYDEKTDFLGEGTFGKVFRGN
jgi:hypothetical protein